jgi:phosphoglycolate phosphatase
LKNALLFDLDGTLTDSFEGISRCLQYAMERMGVAVAPDFDLRATVGAPLHDLLAELGVGDRAAEATAFYRERFNAVGMYENAVYDGVTELLEHARTRFRLFVCTSKLTASATRILEHFNLHHYFERVYGSEADGRFQRKTELFAHVLESERIAPQCATLVGDRKHDAIAAVANGATAFGAAWGYGSIEELTAAGAHRIFATPMELQAALA